MRVEQILVLLPRDAAAEEVARQVGLEEHELWRAAAAFGGAECHVPSGEGHLGHQLGVGLLAQQRPRRGALERLPLQAEVRVRVHGDGAVPGAQGRPEGLPPAGVPVCGAGASAEDLARLPAGDVHHDAAVVGGGALAAGAPHRGERLGLGHFAAAAELGQRAVGACDHAHRREGRVCGQQAVHGIAVVQLVLEDPPAAVHHVLEHVDAHAALLEHVLGHKRHGLVHHGRDRNALLHAGLDEHPLVLQVEVLALRRQGRHRCEPAVQAPELEPVGRREQRAPEAVRRALLEAVRPAPDGPDKAGNRDDDEDRKDRGGAVAGEDGQGHAVEPRRKHDVAQVGEHVLLEGAGAVVRLPHEPRHRGQAVQVRAAEA
mmetsp:Transcript_15296/g.33439  ORF Transcript_15296/g.33439 Transcript_15296/m.33439 type:complete len:373 (-) Transcript_15296:344-1462(-)